MAAFRQALLETVDSQQVIKDAVKERA
jgi:hypothetical protein